MVIRGVRDMLDEANATIETVTAEQALPLLGGTDTVFVDVRETGELEREGRIPGAIHCPRGILEFQVDPSSPMHNPVFSGDRRIMFFCAIGGRSALAGLTATQMGLERVAHMAGGFSAWREAGGAVEDGTGDGES